MARLGKEHLRPMSIEGDEVRARRERLGMDKKALAEAARVNRNTLSAIEAGESFNRTTLTKIERALEELEAEAGIDAPAPRVEEDVAAQTRARWPQDVRVFLDVMGVYLSSMDEEKRKATIRDLVQQIVGSV